MRASPACHTLLKCCTQLNWLHCTCVNIVSFQVSVFNDSKISQSEIISVLPVCFGSLKFSDKNVRDTKKQLGKMFIAFRRIAHFLSLLLENRSFLPYGTSEQSFWHSDCYLQHVPKC